MFSKKIDYALVTVLSIVVIGLFAMSVASFFFIESYGLLVFANIFLWLFLLSAASELAYELLLQDWEREESKPRLFYYEDAEDCWCPINAEDIHHIVDVTNMEDGEVFELSFKRVDMTDEEFGNIQEV